MGEERIQARKQFVCSRIKDLHRFVLCKQHEQYLRLAPTSKKDASHSCLISLNWKQECTTMCCSGRGMPFRVTNSCGRSKSQKLPPKQTIPLMGTALKIAFLWGRNESKPASSLSTLGLRTCAALFFASDVSSF